MTRPTFPKRFALPTSLTATLIASALAGAPVNAQERDQQREHRAHQGIAAQPSQVVAQRVEAANRSPARHGGDSEAACNASAHTQTMGTPRQPDGKSGH